MAASLTKRACSRLADVVGDVVGDVDVDVDVVGDMGYMAEVGDAQMETAAEQGRACHRVCPSPASGCYTACNAAGLSGGAMACNRQWCGANVCDPGARESMHG